MDKKISITRGYGFFEEFLAKKRYDIAGKLIPDVLRQGRILDIGCGKYPYFLNSVKFAEKYGIDQSLNGNHEHLPENMRLREFNVETGGMFPFDSEYFDVITMLAICEHISPESLPEKFAEIYRMLKPGGSFIITTPASWTGFILSGMSRIGLISREEIREHKYLYSCNRILKILSSRGFQIGKIKAGFFELGMNMWIKAEK